MSQIDALIERARARGGPAVFLTGAGVSAESGVPTFRGPGGYWQVGSRNYHPQELATHAAFSELPWDVWAWYLYRRGVCRGADSNPAHRALAQLEPVLAERFLLITQNVDGLHLRAGNTLERCYQIHGNIDLMRCAEDCRPTLHPIPEAVPIEWPKGRAVSAAERAALVCPDCGARARPHVLWFDECYDERHFRFASSREAAAEAALLVIAGTAGATNLPNQVAALAARGGASLIAVNLEDSPFMELAEAYPHGAAVYGRAGEELPALCERLGAWTPR